ncbi:MAG: ABC transporter permease subunit [bacterium]|nr:ABC transporter permease subunit [bacterium]
MTFIKHELYINKKTLFIWSVLMGAVIFVMMLLYPTMQDSIGTMTDIYKNMGIMTSMFGMDRLDMSTAIGFYGIEMGAMLSIGGGMFAAIIGISMLSKEEGGHTSEYLYVMPKSRSYFITQKLVAAALLIIIYNVVCFVVSILSFVVIGEDIEMKKLTTFMLSELLMNLQIGAMCFGISAILRKNNVGLGIGISILFYFISMLANVTDKVEKLHYITPYYYCDAAVVMVKEEIPLGHLGIGIGVAAACIVFAYIFYNKRDLAI